jgi:hypothetical protein
MTLLSAAKNSSNITALGQFETDYLMHRVIYPQYEPGQVSDSSRFHLGFGFLLG